MRLSGRGSQCGGSAQDSGMGTCSAKTDYHELGGVNINIYSSVSEPGSLRPECQHGRVLSFFLDYMAGFLLYPHIVRRQQAPVPSSHYRAQIPLWGLQSFDFFQTQLLPKGLSSKSHHTGS